MHKNEMKQEPNQTTLVRVKKEMDEPRKHETALNQFAQFKIEANDIGNRDRPVRWGLIPAWDSHRRQL
jgi:hypothetical protein